MNNLQPKYGSKEDKRHENFEIPKKETNKTMYIKCLNKECNPDELITHTTCSTVFKLGGWKLYACSLKCWEKIF